MRKGRHGRIEPPDVYDLAAGLPAAATAAAEAVSCSLENPGSCEACQ